MVDPKRGKVAPADFEPDDRHRMRCQELRLDLAAELRDFKLFEFNRAYSDWPRRFSRWIEDSRLKRETESAKRAPGRAEPRPKTAAEARAESRRVLSEWGGK